MLIGMLKIKSDGDKCDDNCPYLVLSGDSKLEPHKCNFFEEELKSFKGCYRCKECIDKYKYKNNT